MKLSHIFTSIVVLLTSVHSQQTQLAVITYNYADFNQPLSALASTMLCASFFEGAFPTVGNLPNAAYIGEGPAVTSGPDGSITGCGTCWKLTSTSTGSSVNILMVSSDSSDSATSGSSNFGIGPEAMDSLNNYQSPSPQTVTVTAEEVDTQNCDFNPLSINPLGPPR